MNVETESGRITGRSDSAADESSEWTPESWVDRHGDYLFDYAMMRMRVAAAAKDAVQETFLAALRGRSSFRGTSGERAWLLGILKHKIHDYFRASSRQPSFAQLNLQPDETTGEYRIDGLHKGAWIPEFAPTDWPVQPGEGLDHEAFWQVFYHCAGKLPRQTARAFMLRELDDLQTEEICSMLEITQNNLWVLLHRARAALRRCLETNWFSKLNE